VIIEEGGRLSLSSMESEKRKYLGDFNAEKKRVEEKAPLVKGGVSRKEGLTRRNTSSRIEGKDREG